MKQWLLRLMTFATVGLLLCSQPALGVAGRSAVSAPAAALMASTKSTISYQGYLVGADGTPVNATALAMIFRFYNVASSGTPLWQEAQSVAVSNGLFSVLLGEITPIPTALLADNSDLWLGITIGSDTELAPREKIASAPYALLANVPDGSITGAKIVSSAITTDKIADNAVTTAKIQDGEVRTADVLNLAVTTDKLAADAVTTAKIKDGEVSSSDVGFNYAASSGKGGAASDLACTTCVSSGEVSFNYANSVGKAGAASDLACTNCVSNGEVDFNYAAANGKAGKANDADALDGYDSSNFSAAGHNHDSSYVNASGDAMTGDLSLTSKLFINDRVTSPANTDLVIDAGYPTINKLILLDHVQVRGDLEMVNSDTSRGDGGRALVHGINDTLEINFNRDFAGGILANNFRTGAIVEENLMTPDQRVDFSLLPFEQGDVLCWDSLVDQLALCTAVASPLVVAVADDQGKPIVLGAEPVKVTGIVEPGDLLVSSDEAGYAAAWSQVGDDTAPIGLVIAKALESSAGESGLIKAMILGR